MPFAPYDRATLDARAVCVSWASRHSYMYTPDKCVKIIARGPKSTQSICFELVDLLKSRMTVVEFSAAHPMPMMVVKTAMARRCRRTIRSRLCSDRAYTSAGGGHVSTRTDHALAVEVSVSY